MNRDTLLLLAFFVAIFIPAALFSQENSEPYFTNVAAETGLASVPAQRVAWVDLNGDHYPDCVLGRVWEGKYTSVFLSIEEQGKRVFKNCTAQSGINLSVDGKSERIGTVIIFGDVDNDGDVDIFSGRYCEFEKPKVDPKTGELLRDEKGNVIFENPDDGVRSEILLNDGKGYFTILPDSGVQNPPATTCAAAFLDYDNDGVLDLFVGNWYKAYGISLECYVSRLYRGLGNGKFEDVTEKAGLLTVSELSKPDSSRPVYGVSHCDYNNDGFQDILVCVYGRQANFLWKNNGDGTFADFGSQTHFDGDGIRHGQYPEWMQQWWSKRFGKPREDEPQWRSHGNTFSAACGDYDSDGDIDIFLGEITHAWAGSSSDLSSLLENLGSENDFVFRRKPYVIPRKHIDEKNWNQGDMHVAWFDFDNDGLLDLLISSGDYPDGQYLRLFRQIENREFVDVTDKCGFDWESSAGISLADFDRDGDIDILAGKSWFRLPKERQIGDFPAPALFRNNIGNKNNWIVISLEGKGADGANKNAIGARVKVKVGEQTQVREVYGGCGHSGQVNSFDLHFGLGKAEKIDSIIVQWNNKDKTGLEFTDVSVNQFVKISETGQKIERLK